MECRNVSWLCDEESKLSVIEVLRSKLISLSCHCFQRYDDMVLSFVVDLEFQISHLKQVDNELLVWRDYATQKRF